MTSMTYKLYDSAVSGNCYKVRLLMAQLNLAYERIQIDTVQQENRLPEFLQKNPQGKVPVLEIDAQLYLPESNAILLYLAEGTALLPTEKLDRTRVMQWLFFEQYSLGMNLSRPRFWISVTHQAEQFATEIKYHHQLGYRALAVMEQHLATQPFFAVDRYTIADIALYAYTHVADAGGYEMAQFPNIKAWCNRVQAQPRYVPLSG
jgi:glutathione S-transferase